MGVLIISPELQKEIDAIVADATGNPIPWAILQEHAVHPDVNPGRLDLKDRRNASTPRPEPRHIQIGTYLVAFSIEEQPIGMIRHLSMSTKDPVNTLPAFEAMEFVARAFGFELTTKWHSWVEEFAPGMYAANLVEPTGAPSNIPTGHA